MTEYVRPRKGYVDGLGSLEIAIFPILRIGNHAADTPFLFESPERRTEIICDLINAYIEDCLKEELREQV